MLGPTASGRRGRFIVLGSSGECLPVNRTIAKRQMFAKSTNRTDSNSTYSSCNSSDGHDDVGEEMYFSAKTSFDEFVEGKPFTKIVLKNQIRLNEDTSPQILFSLE